MNLKRLAQRNRLGIVMCRCFVLLQSACAVLLLPYSIHAVPPVQFSAATNYAVAGGPRAIACADFNHDGGPDLVTVNQTANSVSVLLGLGGGVFQSPTNLAVGANPVSMAIGDFNTNGHWDIVTASYSPAGSVSLLSGNADGTFTSATNWSVGDRPAASRWVTSTRITIPISQSSILLSAPQAFCWGMVMARL